MKSAFSSPTQQEPHQDPKQANHQEIIALVGRHILGKIAEFKVVQQRAQIFERVLGILLHNRTTTM